MKIFRDRSDAGRQLGEQLRRQPLNGTPIVLGLPRGGVPVAYEVAAVLGAPLDVLIVRKLGAPFNPELAVGAIAYGGIVVYNEDLLDMLHLSADSMQTIRVAEQEELARRERVYRGERPPPEIDGKSVILVDDGVATGASMEAAVRATRVLGPREIIVAVPTSARDSLARLEAVADRVVVIETPEPYFGVGAWYEDFSQLTDDEVLGYLDRSRREEKHVVGRERVPRPRAVNP
jgi:predicted phosphoribosyltransferase